jgi:hypothetical protein
MGTFHSSNKKHSEEWFVDKDIPTKIEEPPLFDAGEIDWIVVTATLNKILEKKKQKRKDAYTETRNYELANRGVSLNYLFQWWEDIQKEYPSG